MSTRRGRPVPAPNLPGTPTAYIPASAPPPCSGRALGFKQFVTSQKLSLEDYNRNRFFESPALLTQLQQTLGTKDVVYCRLSTVTDNYATPASYDHPGVYVGPICFGQFTEIQRLKSKIPSPGSEKSPKLAQNNRITLEVWEVECIRNKYPYLLQAAVELNKGDMPAEDTTFGMSEQVSVGVKLGEGKLPLFEISRLVKNLAGELKSHRYEQVTLNKNEMNNLLYNYYDALLASVQAKLNGRSIFARGELVPDFGVIMPSVVERVAGALAKHVLSLEQTEGGEEAKRLLADRLKLGHVVRNRIRLMTPAAFKDLIWHLPVFWDGQNRLSIAKGAFPLILSRLSTLDGSTAIIDYVITHYPRLIESVQCGGGASAPPNPEI